MERNGMLLPYGGFGLQKSIKTDKRMRKLAIMR